MVLGDPWVLLAYGSLVSHSWWAGIPTRASGAEEGHPGAGESLCPAEWPPCSLLLGRGGKKDFHPPPCLFLFNGSATYPGPHGRQPGVAATGHLRAYYLLLV